MLPKTICIVTAKRNGATLNSTTRFGIVVVVAAGVAAAIVLKERAKPQANESPVQASNTTAVSGISTSASAVPTVTTPLPRLLDLGAGKCTPCKMMVPVMEELRKEYAGRMEVGFIDVWENRDAGKEFSVEAIPTKIFFAADGQELFRHTGFLAKDDFLAKWQELGVDLDE